MVGRLPTCRCVGRAVGGTPVSGSGTWAHGSKPSHGTCSRVLVDAWEYDPQMTTTQDVVLALKCEAQPLYTPHRMHASAPLSVTSVYSACRGTPYCPPVSACDLRCTRNLKYSAAGHIYLRPQSLSFLCPGELQLYCRNSSS